MGFLQRWRRGDRNSQKPRVLAATRSRAALHILHDMAENGEVDVVEAVSTTAVNGLLAKVHLAVIDPDDLVPVHISHDGIEAVLRASGVPHVLSTNFLERPQEWIQQAKAFSGDVTSLPPRMVVFTSLDSGGVGKTTLTFNLSLDFQRRTNLPTAMSELSRAASGLLAVLTSRMNVDARTFPDAHHVANQGATPAVWHWRNSQKPGITVLPMREQTGRLVSDEAYRAVLGDIVSAHILTVVDAVQPHPLWPVVQEMADVIFVLATPHRPESMVNADLLMERLPAEKARLVLNMAGSMERVVSGKEAIVLPRDETYARYEGNMTPILRSVWPSFPNK